MSNKPKLPSSYDKVIKGLCPLCNKPLIQSGKRRKCPDCGMYPRLKGA